MSFIRKKTNRAITLTELSIVALLTPMLLWVVSNYLITWLNKYKETQVTTFILQENIKILKTIWWIRFWYDVIWIDSVSNLTTLTIDMWEQQTMSFMPWTVWTDLEDDIIFTNKNGQVINIYDNRFLQINKFQAIELDDAINRKWIRFNINISVNWEKNDRVAKKFWKNVDKELEYSITYTFRNKNNDI